MAQEETLQHWRGNIYLFLTSQFFTGITSMIVQYAIIWYLTKATGSATILSLATLLGMLPMVLLSPFVGPYVDRLNKKLLLIVPDIVAALVAIVLAAVGLWQGDFPVWLIFISLLVRSIAQTFQMPTVQSILPTMVPATQLTKINGQLGMVQSANFIIAPALGAFLFALMPLPFLILFDVLGAIIGVSILTFVRIPEHPKATGKAHVLADSKQGLALLRAKKGLWQITLMGTFFTLVFVPAMSLYPLMTIDHFRGTVGQAGLVEVVYSVGALVGGMIIGFLGNWSDRMKPIFGATVVLGLLVGFCGLLPGNRTGFWWFVALNTVVGLATPFFNTLLMAMIQQSYPPENLGKVLGIMNALMSLAGPIGLIFAGPLADKIGVARLFLIAGVGTLFCGAFLWLNKTTWQYDRQLQASLKKPQDTLETKATINTTDVE